MIKSLKKLSWFSGRTGPLLLIIMDGLGIAKPSPGNAVYHAHTPYLDRLYQSALFTKIKAHGTAVGMPTDEDMGNSEVGHNALGAGRIFKQGASLASEAISSGHLYQGSTWKDSIQNCRHHNGCLHFIGLLSDGNVHSHIHHLLDMLTNAQKSGITKARIHCLLDGRDVEEKSALRYIEQLESHLNHLNQSGSDYQIASGGGRMSTTMDRYNADWDMVKRGWETHVRGIGPAFSSAKEAIRFYYDEDPNRIDQDLPNFVIHHDNTPIGKIQDGDSVICINFRGDRVIELSMAFEDDHFDYFDRVYRPKVHYAGMIQYDGDRHIPTHFLIDPPQIEHPISEYLCDLELRSLAISETQKYGHVTYFWNGNRSDYINKSLETYINIPSKTIPFDQQPEMRAYEITEKTIDCLNSQSFDFARVNLPNCDMIGHTGHFEAAKKATEVTDECVKAMVDANSKLGGISVILADHGNAETMYEIKNNTRISKPSHTLNPVPFIIHDPAYNHEYQYRNLPEPGLANVASTLCHLLGYSAPTDYEPSLIEAKKSSHTS
ncbi:MAG: phosphoglycerate mutase (2,3-diphosphoglycerate-independent) [Actinobacteria bacterium]|nr:phosphoglycerate mutase (2,3-diphosphoglycerate-independent) [Actinomycetota bacterium]